MPRSITLVAARKALGTIVEEVGRTGTPVSLTRRGKIVARIVPEERARVRDPLEAMRGSAELLGSFGALNRDLRALREEAGRVLEHRSSRLPRPPARRRG